MEKITRTKKFHCAFLHFSTEYHENQSTDKKVFFWVDSLGYKISESYCHFEQCNYDQECCKNAAAQPISL